MISQDALMINSYRWPDATEPELRAHLGRYEVTGQDALKPMKFSSGGQKSRVAFVSVCGSVLFSACINENALDYIGLFDFCSTPCGAAGRAGKNCTAPIVPAFFVILLFSLAWNHCFVSLCHRLIILIWRPLELLWEHCSSSVVESL